MTSGATSLQRHPPPPSCTLPSDHGYENSATVDDVDYNCDVPRPSVEDCPEDSIDANSDTSLAPQYRTPSVSISPPPSVEEWTRSSSSSLPHRTVHTPTSTLDGIAGLTEDLALLTTTSTSQASTEAARTHAREESRRTSPHSEVRMGPGVQRQTIAPTLLLLIVPTMRIRPANNQHLGEDRPLDDAQIHILTKVLTTFEMNHCQTTHSIPRNFKMH